MAAVPLTDLVPPEEPVAQMATLFDRLELASPESLEEDPEPDFGGRYVLLGQGLFRTAEPEPEGNLPEKALTFLGGLTQQERAMTPEEEVLESMEPKDPTPEQKKTILKVLKEKPRGEGLSDYLYESAESDLEGLKEKEQNRDREVAWLNAGPESDRVDFDLPFEDAPYTNPILFLERSYKRVQDLCERKLNNGLSKQVDRSKTCGSGRDLVNRIATRHLAEVQGLPDPEDQKAVASLLKARREEAKPNKKLVQKYVRSDLHSQSWKRRMQDLDLEAKGMAKIIGDAHGKVKYGLDQFPEVQGSGLTLRDALTSPADKMQASMLMAQAMTEMTVLTGQASEIQMAHEAAFSKAVDCCESRALTCSKTLEWYLANHEKNLAREKVNREARLLEIDGSVDAHCASGQASVVLEDLRAACQSVASWQSECARTLSDGLAGTLTGDRKALVKTSAARLGTLSGALTSSIRASLSCHASGCSNAKRISESFGLLKTAYRASREESREALMVLVDPESGYSKSDRDLPSRSELESKALRALEGLKALNQYRPEEPSGGLLSAELARDKAKVDRERVLALGDQFGALYLSGAVLLKWKEGLEGPLRRADLALDKGRPIIEGCQKVEAMATGTRSMASEESRNNCLVLTREAFLLGQAKCSESRAETENCIRAFASEADRLARAFALAYAERKAAIRSVLQKVALLDTGAFRTLTELETLLSGLLAKIHESTSLSKALLVRESCMRALQAARAIHQK